MSFIPPEDLNFEKYKASLKAKLKTYPNFTDWDMEGSNFSVLIDILAYNTYNNAHYLNMIGSEAFVDSAQLRESLVSHATDLNYLPRSRRSSYTTVNVQIYPSDTPSSITIPKNYRFKTSDPDGNTIYFLTDRDHTTARSDNGTYIFENIDLYEGSIVKEFFTVDGIIINENGFTEYNQTFLIQSENVDISSIEVLVKESISDTGVFYKRSDTLQGVTKESKVFFVRGFSKNQYVIEFGDGVSGFPVSNGNIIEVSYRNTQGVTVQGNYTLSKTSPIDGYPDIQIIGASRVQGGFERESIENIRFNAPRYFQTQNRAVTETDYEVLIRKDFPQIQQVSVFGGEEIFQYGKVFIVLKPFGTTGIVSNALKNQIVEYLKEKNIVPEPVIIDPQYYYLGIDSVVDYTGSATSLTSSQIKTNIINNLNELNNKELGDFKTTAYQSLITDTINSSDNSIIGSDAEIHMIKIWTPTRNINETLKLNLGNPIRKSRDGQYTRPEDYSIISTQFSVFASDEVMTCVIQDDGIGNLHLYSVNGSEKMKLGNAIGNVNYDSGDVTLTTQILDYSGFIKIHFYMQNNTIRMLRDNFIIVDASNINIEMNRK